MTGAEIRCSYGISGAPLVNSDPERLLTRSARPTGWRGPPIPAAKAGVFPTTARRSVSRVAIPRLLDRLLRSDAPYGVVAEFRGECGPDDFDGACWELLIADGTSTGIVEVELSASDGGCYGMEVRPEAIEHATECLAADFPLGKKAACMIAWCEHVGPLYLREAGLELDASR